MPDDRNIEFRRLRSEDRPAIRVLLHHDNGYATRVDGSPASESAVDELLAERLDPGIEKSSFGLFCDGALVAVADVARGLPAPDCAYLGLLQVDARCHGRGWGRLMHDRVLDVARGWEATRIRLGVVDTNASVLPFWRALGYAPTGELKEWSSASGTPHRVDLLERDLGPA